MAWATEIQQLNKQLGRPRTLVGVFGTTGTDHLPLPSTKLFYSLSLSVWDHAAERRLLFMFPPKWNIAYLKMHPEYILPDHLFCNLPTGTGVLATCLSKFSEIAQGSQQQAFILLERQT